MGVVVDEVRGEEDRDCQSTSRPTRTNLLDSPVASAADVDAGEHQVGVGGPDIDAHRHQLDVLGLPNDVGDQGAISEILALRLGFVVAHVALLKESMGLFWREWPKGKLLGLIKKAAPPSKGICLGIPGIWWSAARVFGFSLGQSGRRRRGR